MTAGPEPHRGLRAVPSSTPGRSGAARTGAARSRSTRGPATARASAISGDAARTIRVPWRPISVTHVRRAIVEDLEMRGVSEVVVDEAEIVVSELVSNAIRHARPLTDGMLRVHWKVKAGVVEVEVTDGGGDTTPRPAPRSIWAPSGRGLRIVRGLAHEWGVTEDRNGSTVWASLGGPSRRRSH